MEIKLSLLVYEIARRKTMDIKISFTCVLNRRKDYKVYVSCGDRIGRYVCLA